MDDSFDLGALNKRMQSINNQEDDEIKACDEFYQCWDRRIGHEEPEIREAAGDILECFNDPEQVVNTDRKIDTILAYAKQRVARLKQEDDAFLQRFQEQYGEE